MTLPLEENSDDFVFDNEVIVQLVYFDYEVAEITCPAKYFEEASSINWWRSIEYGLGVLRTTLRYIVARAGLKPHRLLRTEGRRLSFDRDRQERGPRTVPVSM
jgi:hypothetical protein